MIPPPPTSTLFPYTTLFRSPGTVGRRARQADLEDRSGSPWNDRSQPLGRALRLRRGDEGAPRVRPGLWRQDRKSTRLNSSHSSISYAVFCLKKKKKE